MGALESPLGAEPLASRGPCRGNTESCALGLGDAQALFNGDTRAPGVLCPECDRNEQMAPNFTFRVDSRVIF